MFDEDKHIESDSIMRSILSQAREDVPERVWEGISSELDRIQATKVRKPVTLWFRRSAAAAAAAAAVILGTIVTDNNEDIITATSESGLIQVKDSPQINLGNVLEKPGLITERPYMADASEEVEKAIMKAEDIADAEMEPVPAIQAKTKDVTSEKEEVTEEAAEEWPEIWEEEVSEVKEKKRKGTAIMISGTAGTNGTPGKGPGPLRKPSQAVAKPKTGVRQTGSESTYGLPVSFGAGVMLDLGKRWALGVGVNYTMLTRKFFGTYTLVNDGKIEESISSDIRNTQQYVGIPVNAFYNIVQNDYLNFYAYAGGTVERCLSDKYDILSTEHIHKESVTGVQFSAALGIGVEFMLGRHLGLYLDPSLRYYFDCNQPKSIRTAQPLMLGFEMGFRINL